MLRSIHACVRWVRFPASRRVRCVIVIAAALVGCTPESGEQTPQQPADTSSASVPQSARDSIAAWTVRPTGAGSIRIGMSFSELAPYMSASVDTTSIGGDCGYVAITDAPDSMRFMVEARKLVRIEVTGGTATAEGARIGDTEQRILELYPAARRLPHKYTDGNYLIAIPGAPADTLHRYVFETDGNRVTEYRAGAYPQVEYVEGCS